MTSKDASILYTELAFIRADLRALHEHGLANLVYDRMCHIHNMITAEDKKNIAIALADSGIT